MSLGRLNELHDMPAKKQTSDCRQKSGMNGEIKRSFWEIRDVDSMIESGV